MCCEYWEQGQKELGNAWTEIAKGLSGRSVKHCVNRFKSSVIKNKIISKNKKEEGEESIVHRVQRDWTPGEVRGDLCHVMLSNTYMMSSVVICHPVTHFIAHIIMGKLK